MNSKLGAAAVGRAQTNKFGNKAASRQSFSARQMNGGGYDNHGATAATPPPHFTEVSLSSTPLPANVKPRVSTASSAVATFDR